MRTESGVRARSDNPRSRGPAPDLLRVELRSTIETATAPGGPPTAFHLSLVGGRPCRLVPLRGAGREVADRDLKAGVVGQALQLDLPQPRATGVRATAVGGDRQARRVRVASFAEVLPPRQDRVHGELRGIARDSYADPTLVGGQVIHPIGDRVPELLVLEVMTADLDRPALGLQLPANGLEIADQLSLFGVDADHRLPGRDRSGHGLVDVLKLGVAIRMTRALPRLLVGLQRVPLGLQQPQHRAIKTS